jgi:threonine/homoserine/homoserine lactone efflux protein
VATYLLLGATYAFAAAVQPGPFQAYLISQTLSHGWRGTLPAAFSPLLSDGPVIVVVLLVLSRMPGWLMPALQTAGGVLLLYLAWSAARAWRVNAPASPTGAPGGSQSLLRAALVNLVNPGPWLGWSLVMGPLLLKGWQAAPRNGVALLAAFYATMILSLAGIITLFAAARQVGPRVSRALIGLSAVALACFGAYQLWTGLSTIW